jgi:hypothetical protein
MVKPTIRRLAKQERGCQCGLPSLPLSVLFFPFLFPGQEIPEIQKILRLLAEKGRARVTEWAEAEKKEARPISTLPLSKVGMGLFFPEAPTGRSSFSFSLFLQATIEWATSHFLKKNISH